MTVHQPSYSMYSLGSGRGHNETGRFQGEIQIYFHGVELEELDVRLVQTLVDTTNELIFRETQIKLFRKQSRFPRSDVGLTLSLVVISGC